MKIRALAPWFGANRELAETVGELLGPRAWVGVPFMGGGSELPHIRAREGVANDLHAQVVNLARVIRDPDLCAELAGMLDRTLVHVGEYREAQERCRERVEAIAGGSLFGKPATPDALAAGPSVVLAFDYFVCCWMGPGGFAGKASEFGSFFPVRWTSSGGSTARRFRSAVESLPAWCKALRSWTFLSVDAFEFLDRVVDQADHAIYCDPPWPDAGREYAHAVSDARFHERLERRLREFQRCAIVVRYGDHPLIRELYGDGWAWLNLESINQAGRGVPEALIVRSIGR